MFVQVFEGFLLFQNTLCVVRRDGVFPSAISVASTGFNPTSSNSASVVEGHCVSALFVSTGILLGLNRTHEYAG